MLGIIKSWFSSNLGGLQVAPNVIGYKKLIIQPAIVGNLTQASSTYTTPYGLASSSWTTSGSKLQLQVTVPVNTTATIELPLNAVATANQGFQGFKDGYATYLVGSGNYTFMSDLS